MFVSIVMCTFNGEDFILQQLNSIASQDVLPDELIICDDCSTDGTIQLIEEFISKASFPVSLHKNEAQLGPRKNFEKGITLSSGDIIFLSDQDDVWEPQKIKTFLSFFNSHPEVLLLFSNGELINSLDESLTSTLWDKWGFDSNERELWKKNDYAFNNLINNNNKITGATAAFRSQLKNWALPFPDKMEHWHDTWLGLFAAANNGLAFYEDCLMKYRVHSAQQVGIGNGVSTQSLPEVDNNIKRIEQIKFYLEVIKRLPSKFINNSVINLKEEMHFLQIKVDYPQKFLFRLPKVFSLNQIKGYKKFSSRPYIQMIKDVLYIQ